HLTARTDGLALGSFLFSFKLLLPAGGVALEAAPSISGIWLRGSAREARTSKRVVKIELGDAEAWRWDGRNPCRNRPGRAHGGCWAGGARVSLFSRRGTPREQ